MIPQTLRSAPVRPLLLLSALLLVACGGRSLGAPSADGQSPHPDHWVGPDNTGDCTDVTDQVGILTSDEPSFVYSVDRTSGSRYVVGCSQGGSEQRAQLLMLDSDNLARLGSVGVDAETVHARFDQWTGEVVAQAETNNEVWYLRYQIIAGRNLELIAEHFLCDHCVTAWGGPETVEAYAGAAIRDLTDNRIRVFVMPRDESGEIFATEPVEGTSPQLVAAGAALSLLYVHDQQLWDRYLDHDGGLQQPIGRTQSPTESLLGASSYSDGIVGAVVLLAVPSEPRLEIIVWSGPWGENSVSMPAPMDDPVEGSVTFSHGIVGFVWGQNHGEVGAFIAGGEPSPFQSTFGPYRVSDPVNQSASTYAIFAATSYHDDGFAVLWGGWDEDHGNGIYGKIVSCSFSL